MGVLATAMKELMAAGLEGEALVRAVARIEAAMLPERSARQERNARYHRWRKTRVPRTKEWARLRQIVIERDGLVCGYCLGLAVPPHVDHVIPVSKGGTSDLDNLMVACSRCNVAKNNRTPSEWEATCV